LVFLYEVEYRTSDCNIYICDDLATSCKNFVNFGPVTPELKKVEGLHPLTISSLPTQRHC